MDDLDLKFLKKEVEILETKSSAQKETIDDLTSQKDDLDR